MDNQALETLRNIFILYLDEQIGEDIVGARSIELSVYEDFVRDTICLKLIQEIYGYQADKIHYRYPADWWQAFKRRYAPEWFKRHWPIQETELIVDVKLLYPKGEDQAPVINALMFKDGHRVWFDGYKSDWVG